MTTIADLVKEYRDIRDSISLARKAFETVEKEGKLRMLELETEMLEMSNKLGVDSFKTVHGTAYKTMKTYARLGTGPEAKQARIDYALSSGDFGLFTSHVNKTHAKELLDDGVNLATVGIDWIQEWAIGFRKPS